MRNENKAGILRGEGSKPRSKQKRGAQVHVIYWLFPLRDFNTNFWNGGARCKRPSLFPKATSKNEGEGKQRRAHFPKRKWIIGSNTNSQLMSIWTILKRHAMRLRKLSAQSEDMPKRDANLHFPVPRVFWKSCISNVVFGILSCWSGSCFLPSF